MYYLRTKPAANAIQFSIDKSKMKKVGAETNGTNGTNGEASSKSEEESKAYNMSGMVCSLENKDDCLMCGS